MTPGSTGSDELHVAVKTDCVGSHAIADPEKHKLLSALSVLL